MAVIKEQFTLRLKLENHAKIKKIAKKENRSLTSMIEYLVMKEIEKYEKENGEIILTEEELYSDNSSKNR